MIGFGLLLIILSLNAVQCSNEIGLVLPEERTTGLGCIPEGETVNYDCTVTDTTGGVALTVWQGSAFNCTDSFNQIVLVHSQYGSGASGICGALTAEAVGVTGSEYTSRLNLTASPDLEGRMINCTLSGSEVIGSDIIKTGKIPPNPSGPLTIGSSGMSLIVSWSPPSVPVVGGVGLYMFTVTGVRCGCVSTNISADTTNVTCSEWEPNGQTCSFEVRTVSEDCGLLSESIVDSLILSGLLLGPSGSNNSGIVIEGLCFYPAIVPGTPRDLSIKLKYNRNGSLQHIAVRFAPVSIVFLGGNLDRTVSYTITFAGDRTFHFTNPTCGSNSCTLTVDGSQLSQNDRYTVSVEAFNVFGTGDAETIPNPIVVDDNVAKLTVDARTSTALCTLSMSFVEAPDVTCSLDYGPLPNNCNRFTDSSIQKTGGPGTNFTILLSQDVNNGLEYCYTVTVMYGSVLVEVDGTFTLGCKTAVLGSNLMSLSSGPQSVLVPNGVIVFTGIAPGSIAHLTCDSGYIASEDTRDRTCLLSGVWSGSSQTCIPTSASSLTTEITVVVVVMIFVILGVGIFIVFVMLSKRCSTSNRRQAELNTEEGPDLFIQGNPAYGDVQPRQDQDGRCSQSSMAQNRFSAPVYEDPDEFLGIKPYSANTQKSTDQRGS